MASMGKFQPSSSKSPKRPKQALFPASQTKAVGRRKPMRGPRKPTKATYGRNSKVSSKRQPGQKQPPTSSSPKTGINTSLRGLNF